MKTTLSSSARRVLSAGLFTAVVLAGAASAQQAIFDFPTAPMVTREDSLFVNLAKEYFAWSYSVNPVSATYNGVHDFDGELPDLSPEATVQRETMTAHTLQELVSDIDQSHLSTVHRYDYEILKRHLEESLFNMRELRAWEKSPIYYTELCGGSVRSLVSRDFAPWDVRLRSVILRLRKFPGLIDQAEANLKSSPRVFTEVAVKQNAGCISYIENDLLKTAAYAPQLEESLRAATQVAVGALKSYGDWLEKGLLPRSGADPWMGKELYEKKLLYAIGPGESSAELVTRARKRYEEVRGEAISLARKIHAELFPGQERGEGAAADEEMAREVFAEIAKHHVKAEQQAEQCREILARLDRYIREKDIITLPPENTLEVQWTPEFERGVAAGGLESPGALERNLKSFFYVAPVPDDWTEEQKESYLREYNDYMQQIFCIHEALPGHYVNGWYSNQFPSLVRALLSSGTFLEGWAVYSEKMMLDEGYADFDPRLALSRLKWNLRVIINTIIDVGLHTRTMTEQEALDLMIHGGFQEESEARNKIVRASVTSVQLTTYFVGVEGMWRIERLYRDKMKDKFSRKAFNEKVLSFGNPPLDLLEEMMLAEEPQK
ncbi:MAG: DUF885 domain-containing protein [Candidatus Eisenbacteria bacterium]|nr:DUF885 domain-containing protein [Candidatus Eisenbacteria bacterium]